ASGRTWLGRLPALNTANRSPASWRRMPSAIWLRAELPVQSTRTRSLSLMRGHSLMRREHFPRLGRRGRRDPAEEQRGGQRTRQLGDDKSGRVGQADAGERVGEGAGQRYRGVGERGGGGEPVRTDDVEPDRVG